MGWEWDGMGLLKTGGWKRDGKGMEEEVRVGEEG